MRRSVLLTILLVMTLFTGCQESKGNLFFIMFESAPTLFEKTVYANGVGVGEIVDAATAVNGVTRLAVVLNGEHRDLMKDSTAFYVSGGRLTHAALAGYGDPVEPGAKLMGFSSRLGMSWFKAKHLMSPVPPAAAERAAELFKAFEVSPKGQ